MLFAAYRLGRSIINSQESKYWVVSGQDPFETSLVSRAIAKQGNSVSHVQVHGDVFNPLSYKTSLFQRLRAIYGRYVVSHTKSIRVVSNRIKISLQSLGVSPDTITVLPIQTDLEPFVSIVKTRTYKGSALPSFLYVGRFSSEKNVSLLIKAFKIASKGFPEARLTLLGSGYLKKKLQNQVSDLNLETRVIFQDWTDSVANVMQAHDVLCLSSDHEGWAMVILEAAAAGMPIVTTDVGCAGEVVVDGENGRVVSVGVLDDYVEALKQYLHKPEMVKVHGTASFELAKTHSVSRPEYLRILMESYTNSNKNPDILTGND
ncbi:MAG: glycosyltransferase [Candidatus Pacebacteria bacterium]|nr:glycosyltransferase [Candidatus Paceibacterota bacterium]